MGILLSHLWSSDQKNKQNNSAKNSYLSSTTSIILSPSQLLGQLLSPFFWYIPIVFMTMHNDTDCLFTFRSAVFFLAKYVEEVNRVLQIRTNFLTGIS